MVAWAGHRDIGLGLFGESVDLGLPDYYFNALIPLEPLTPDNGTELVMRNLPPHPFTVAAFDSFLALGG